MKPIYRMMPCLPAQRRPGKYLGGLGLRVLALSLALAWQALPAHAAQVRLTDDAAAQAGHNQTLGDQGELVVQGGPGVPANQVYRSFIRFDLSSLPAGTPGSQVARATLKLWVDRVLAAGQLDFYRVAGPWSEQTLNGLNQPPLGALEAGGVPVTLAQEQGFLYLDVTQAVRDWLDGVQANQGLALVAGAGGVSVRFDSKENSGTAREVQLEIILEGPKGDKGDQGDQGIQGEKGDKGDTGPQGPVGPNLLRVALRRWYAANESGITVAVDAQPVGLEFDGANIWVTNQGSDSVTKLRANDGGVLHTISVGDMPSGLAYDGDNIWVANQASNNVTKVRATNGVVLGTFGVGTSPYGVAFDGANIWVANLGSNDVTKLQANTGATLGTFPVGTTPYGVAFDGTNIWVTNRGTHSVTKLLASDGTPVGTYPVGTQPSGVAFDGENIWVANFVSNNVTKLKASDGTTLGTFATGNGPLSVAFDGIHIWVTNNLSNDVTKLRASDGALVGTFATGPNPVGVAFDGANIWVTNSASNTVMKK